MSASEAQDKKRMPFDQPPGSPSGCAPVVSPSGSN
ncbi:UNVERIFIED_CONTAM: hypothetical protein RKD43_002514 [Streptomyces graminofaciens]